MMSPKGPECGGNVKLSYLQGSLAFPHLRPNHIDSNSLRAMIEKPACQGGAPGPCSLH
jgi:hypothetical protein